MTNGIPRQTRNIRTPTPYDDDAAFKALNVERHEELKAAQDWQSGIKRVLAITGPPAQGKSWFLVYFYQDLTIKGSPVFLVKIADFLGSGPIGGREIDRAKLEQWLHNFVAKLPPECRATFTLNKEAEVASNLGALARHISQKCWFGQAIYLCIDGGDEPSEEAFKKIEREIIEPIMAHSSWRLVLTLRREQRLSSYYLSQSQDNLPLPPLRQTDDPTQQHQGYEQIKKLIDHDDAPTPTFEEILEFWPDYPWSHPGLNTFLYEETKYLLAMQEKTDWREAFLERAVGALTDMNDAHRIAELVGWLKEIERMSVNPEWTLEHLAASSGKSRSHVWKGIQPLLFNHPLIINVGNRYKITDGVREFIKMAIHYREKERDKNTPTS